MMKNKFLFAASIITSALIIIFFVFSSCGVRTYRNCLQIIIPIVDIHYTSDKELIAPYFDNEFYKVKYANALTETGLNPIDHFMIFGWKGSWKDHTDPNAWFNTTLYKERLWPCYGNPFIDFLKQPAKTLPAKAKTVDVYATKDEVTRAWLAVEGFLRQNKHAVTLILNSAEFKTVPLCFKPMMARGLNVRFVEGKPVSFYKSPFLKRPHDFAIDTHYSPLENPAHMPMRYVNVKSDYGYMLHNMHQYTKWKQKGLLDPLVLNFGKYCEEPLFLSPYGKNEAEFKSYMERMATGFDLLFTGVVLNTPNARLIPGFHQAWINENELSKEKTFSVSFLLSYSGKGNLSFSKKETRNYYLRQKIWDKEKEFSVPTQFYISRRDMNKYSKELRNRAMPTDSKKWIFNSQFNISIENSNQPNYFTEKLLGCFISMTIPIYMGCTNIGDFFDTRGMFVAQSVDDILSICNSLTPETYAKMLPYLKENKRRAEAFIGLYDRMINDFYEQKMQ
jgi:hypothetical protein